MGWPQPMDDYTTGLDKPNGSTELKQLDDRDVRALTESMTVLPEAPDLYDVVGQNGNGSYTVDLRDGRCTCPDHKYRGVRCKHLRRVAFATGERPLPAWIDCDAVDALLGEHVDATPHVAATDGGVTTDAVDGESEELTDDETPEDCDCEGLPDGVPCWACYRAGRATFEE